MYYKHQRSAMRSSLYKYTTRRSVLCNPIITRIRFCSWSRSCGALLQEAGDEKSADARMGEGSFQHV